MLNCFPGGRHIDRLLFPISCLPETVLRRSWHKLIVINYRVQNLDADGRDYNSLNDNVVYLLVDLTPEGSQLCGSKNVLNY